MRLFFDARYIRTDFHDGVSRYSTELANSIDRYIGHDDLTYIIYTDRQRAFLPSNAKCIKIHSPTSFLEPFTAFVMNRYHPDVVFTPLQTMGSIGRKYRLVLTLHDMIYHHHHTAPQGFNPVIRLGWILFYATYWPQRWLLNHADVVATVSDTVKQQFIDARLTKRPIVVIPNAPNNLSSFLTKPVNLTPKPTNLIYMGSFVSYKNVEMLIRGLAYLPKTYHLHLLSKITSQRQAQLEVIVLPGNQVTFHHGVSDKQYAQLLAHHAIAVNASLDEGYGIPVAEALNLGVPVVIHDIPIFHEVAGKGALYFKTPQQFAQAILALNDVKLRHSLVKAGQKHLQRFSWDKSAKILLRTMRDLG